MNLILKRNRCDLYGVFGEFQDESGTHICFTLEHAYLQPDGSYAPKIPVGSYSCVRGQHRLEGMMNSFETFEITNVPGHTNILIHKGNYNKDSSGCVLVGMEKGPGCILESQAAFDHFLWLQNGCDSFQLTVVNDIPTP